MRLLRRTLVLLPAVLALTGGVAAPAAAAPLGSAASAAAPAARSADDYPWRLDQSWGADAYGFTKRQCVSFVAWRLAQRRTPISNAQGWGSALTWDDTAVRLGHRIGVRPVVGAVAHWNAWESSKTWLNGSTRANGIVRAGSAGHVAYVSRVHADGSVTVQEYNGGGSRAFGTARLRAPRYLYLGVAGPR